MKKIFIFVICSLFLYLNVKSQVRTVSSNANTPGQYSNLQTAIDSAHVGDTIYVHGSTNGYGNIKVNKKLTFIGPGYNPFSQFNLAAYIGSITLDYLVPLSSADGSRFIGLAITNIYKKQTEFYQINDIIFDRCRISSTTTESYVSGDNWIFKNCLFYWTQGGYLNLSFYNNIVISNNFFYFAPQSTSQVAISTSNKASVIINNNIFTGSGSGFFTGPSFSSITSAQFSNNIFFGKSPVGATSSVYTNNLSYACTPSLLPPAGNSGLGNINNADPQFNNIPIGTFTFDYSYDFHLKSTSAGHSAGTDGTDLGIFGGALPMPTNANVISGESKLPQIYYMNIQNNVIDQNTPINVTVKARKMN